MRWHKVVAYWGWKKPQDARNPVEAEIRVEESGTGETLLRLDLTADEVTKLLSGTATRLDVQIRKVQHARVLQLLDEFLSAVEEYDGKDLGALVDDWAWLIARDLS